MDESAAAPRAVRGKTTPDSIAPKPRSRVQGGVGGTDGVLVAWGWRGGGVGMAWGCSGGGAWLACGT